MAVPLTNAMAVNVLFILGAVLRARALGHRRNLFPGAMLAFLLIGWQAGMTFKRFFTRVLAHGTSSATRTTVSARC
jgi:hypothetical protein